ncbi:unnamed protein product [Phytophthora fragariaefolia]|uniref:Unnamed protein product n=1 Tax=Phytophthora fragariaefolia TaxID=1490495 RepID=A0A9W6XEE2_9STRA|nr:unnamed protein product [Phytophthora fragariaefolia]
MVVDLDQQVLPVLQIGPWSRERREAVRLGGVLGLVGRFRSVVAPRPTALNLLREPLYYNYLSNSPAYANAYLTIGIHSGCSARHTKDFLHSESVSTLKWPAKSPDLNTIENVRELLVHRVYAGGRQFDSAAALKRCILKCWQEIPQEYIQTLVKRMPTRIVQVVLRRGAAIDY